MVEYFSELSNAEDFFLRRTLQQNWKITENIKQITPQETREALTWPKNGKSPGENGMSMENFNAAGECTLQFLREIMSLEYKSMRVLAD